MSNTETNPLNRIEQEPTVDSTDPTLTDIYLYKRYIARQEDKSNAWVIFAIPYCILSVVMYIYIDTSAYEQLNAFNAYKQLRPNDIKSV